MVDALRVALLVTTDLPPDTDLAEFGRLLVDSVRTLQRGDVVYAGLLRGGVFWLDRPLPPVDDELPGAAAEELRFAAMLGHLSVPASAASPASARQAVADAGRAIAAAVAARYGDLGSPPAVLAIRSEDVRERTPDAAIPVGGAEPLAAPAGPGSPARPAGQPPVTAWNVQVPEPTP
ncbi:hypothetical protein GCM10010517_47190 [Streptosporangium fragile]|uniref:Uncharacterized protein n=1 Tax=Streptosporangium fragile TaxID=46186 RepID=A0ABP6IHF1_9ACTN